MFHQIKLMIQENILRNKNLSDVGESSSLGFHNSFVMPQNISSIARNTHFLHVDIDSKPTTIHSSTRHYRDRKKMK